MIRRLLLAAAATSTLAAPASAQTPAAQPAAQPVQPIRLNQLGLIPNGPKRAVLANPSTTPLPWRLTDASGAVRAEGRTRVVGDDAASGEHVHLVDFSAFQSIGDGFRIAVGDVQSRPFRIAPNLYDRLPFDALAYFYHNRSGTPILARHAGGAQWARPVAHERERVSCFSGTDEQGNRWPGCSYTLDASRGWYDAGDHGKYVVNGGISLWTLLNAYERRRTAFPDGSANIPESGNRVADILDEARWELDFMLGMQVPDGQRARVPVGIRRSTEGLTFTDIDASGMAHHKLADERWTSLPLAPHDDTMRRFLFPPSTSATLNLAATAAQCARIWRDIDEAFAARCLAAARRAFSAAQRNPEVYAIGNFAGSGGYGDGELSDEFFWAAAELYATTGLPEYEQVLRASPHFTAPVTEAGWPSTAALGTMTLAMVPNRLPTEDVEAIRRRIVAAADGYLEDLGNEGYRLPFSAPNGYAWGSNSNILNRQMLLALAHDFTGDRHYRDAVIDGMDYLLGRNPLDQSYISGYGARPLMNPHHRFWAASLDSRFPGPPPGAVSGGPNSTSFPDTISGPMRGTCRPMTCWTDNIHAYAQNEVAINWNAPLVWVAAYLREQD